MTQTQSTIHKDQQAVHCGALRANVLGVGISAVNPTDTLRLCDELIRQGGRGYISVTGVHGVMEAQSDVEFREILNHSFLCVPDGMPTVWVGRLQGHRAMRRVYGPDFMLDFCRHSLQKGHRHFLYGGGDGVADKLAENLMYRFPGINIVGTYTPPFRLLQKIEEEQLEQMIRDCHPDVIWVGLSTPKQERFMASYIERLDTHLMIGVGAAFDIIPGTVKDAPRWIKNSGMQWMHRLFQEPRRLWRRYLINNPRFLGKIGLQLSGIRHFPLD